MVAISACTPPSQQPLGVPHVWTKHCKVGWTGHQPLTRLIWSIEFLVGALCVCVSLPAVATLLIEFLWFCTASFRLKSPASVDWLDEIDRVQLAVEALRQSRLSRTFLASCNQPLLFQKEDWL
jgi:hypothetical protein